MKDSVNKLVRITLSILLLTVCLLLGSISAFAQVTASAAVGGTVADQKGGVINGATVMVTNKATGSSRTATTNDNGEYKLDFLPAGRYNIKVSAPGFGDVTADDVEILVGHTSNFNVTMNPGVQTANVTVTTETELVSKEKTDISLNITPRDVQDLPINGRDLGNLAYLAPGAKPVDSYDPTKRRISVFGVNGSSGRNVNVTVNGIDNKDNTVGGPVMQFPLEAIQEFVISTARFSAVNGRSEGAAVNVVTKSGGSDFHGSLFYFLRDKKLNASEVSRAVTPSRSLPLTASNTAVLLAALFICRVSERGAKATMTIIGPSFSLLTKGKRRRPQFRLPQTRSPSCSSYRIWALSRPQFYPRLTKTGE